MKAPMLIENLSYAIGYKIGSKKSHRSNKSFFKKYLSVDSDYPMLSSILWVAIIAVVVGSLTMMAVGTGMIKFIEPASREEITKAYQEVLHRAPEKEGLDGYDAADMSYEHIKHDLEGSEEKKTLDKAQKHD